MKKLNTLLRNISVRNMASGSAEGKEPTKLHGIVNDLQYQKSPYLLQHKHNPVEWRPWSPQVHEESRRRNMPIFLSIGYSTCHWCHVMERESFENPQIASIMNTHFVNIKIDREELPDVDRIYMSFVQAVSGSGGWPLSIWLTPSLKPIYGGTYYPPDNRYFGRPGFKSLLLSIAEQWDENQEKCEESAEKIYKLLQKSANIVVSPELPDGKVIMDKCVSQLKRSYEPSFGGFSEAPKFPQPGNLVHLIDYCTKRKGEDIGSVQKMVERTLTMMAQGGIHDHIGKGFARYSTDKKWHVPHFEKMLYDQAQLVEVYALAHRCFKGNENGFDSIVRDIVEYVCRDLSHPEGGFFSAEDADSENDAGVKKEGAFYVWEDAEIDELLPGEIGGAKIADLFKFRYGIREKGNVDPYQDPHDELKNKNVLFEAKPLEKCAEKFEITASQVLDALEGAKQKLFEWREQNRKRPGLDDKIIASWNGLMISRLCLAAQALNNKPYLDRAEKAMRFCKKYLIKEDCDVYRTCYSDKKGGVENLEQPIHGCVDDFANLVSACLALFQASGGQMEWVELARKLQDKQDALFWDEEKGGYFNSRIQPTIIVRMKDDDDGAEPSSNSTSLRNLMQLSQLSKVLDLPESYSPKVVKLIKQFTDRLQKIPIALPLMTSLVSSITDNLSTTLVFDSNLTQEVGEKLTLPYGSVLVPIVEPGKVKKGHYAEGKIVRIRGDEKEILDSVEACA